MRSEKTKKLVLIGVLAAVMLMLNAAGLGTIPIPPLKVTILHIPVIVGALLGGLPVGLTLGLAFGVLSMYNSYVAPVLLSPCFMNPLVSVLPRLLIPLIACGIYAALKNTKLPPSIRVGAAAFAGSLTNTLGVLGMLGLLYGDMAAQAFATPGQGVWIALGLFGATAGIPEAIVCTLISIAVVKAVQASNLVKPA